MKGIKIAKHPLRKMIGLMFQRPKKLLMIWDEDVNYGVHTWFCFFTMKVSFLDKNKKVLESVTMKPFQSYKPRKNYRYILEIPLYV